MVSWRTLGRIVLAVAGATVLLVAAAAGAVYVALQFDDEREWLARTIEELASEPGKMELRLGTIGPGLPRRLTLSSLSLADAQGVWLQATDIVLAWHPFALLHGRLAVDAFTVATLDLPRLPASEPSATTEPTSVEIPHLPFDVRVRQLEVGDVRLGEPVIGQAVTLRIAGKVAAEQDRSARTQLSVERTDGREGAIRLAAEYLIDARALNVDAVAQEPAGGLAVTLMDVPERPPFYLTLAGSGPIADWRGTLRADIQGFAKLDTTIAAQVGETLRARLDGILSPPPDIVPALAPALRDGVRFTIAAAQSGDTVTLDQLELDGNGAKVAASGTLDTQHTAIDARLTAALKSDAVSAAALGSLGFGSADLQATASGAIDAPKVAATLAIGGLTGPGVRVPTATIALNVAPSPAPVPAPADGAAGVLTADASAAVQELQIEPPAAQALLGAAPTLQLHGTFDRQSQQIDLAGLQLTGAGATLAATANADLAQGPVRANATVTIADLAALNRATGLAAAGTITVDAAATGDLTRETFSGDLAARTQRLATGIPAVDALLGAAPTLAASGTYSPTNGIAIPKATVTGANISANADAVLAADLANLRATARVEVPTLAPLSGPLGTPLRGSLRADATASGSVDAPTVRLDATLQNALAADVRIASARLRLDAANVVAAPQGRLQLDAETGYGPVAASTDFLMRPSGVLSISDLMAQGAGLAADGDLDVDLNRTLIAGTLDARIAGPRAGPADATHLEGRGHLSVTLTAPGRRQNVLAQFVGGPLTLADGSTTTAQLATIEASVRIADALATAPALDADATITNLQAGGQRLTSVQARAQGSPSALQIQLALAGDGRAIDRLDLAARLSSARGTTRIELGRLDGRAAKTDLHLRGPAVLALTPSQTTLSGLNLALGTGTLTADARLGPGQTSATVRGTHIPVGLAAPFAAGAPQSGHVDLSADLATVGGETRGHVSAKLDQLGWHAIDQTAEPVRVSADLQAELTGQTTALEGRIDGPRGTRLTLDGRVPARLPPGTLAPAIDHQGAIAGHLTVTADIGQIMLLLAPSDQRAQGKIDGAMTAAGTLSDPHIEGSVQLTDGLYENFVSGTLIKDITAHLDAHPDRTLALKVDGDDGGHGKVGVEGTVHLGADPAVEAKVTADNAKLVRRDDVTAAIDADLTLQGNSEGGALTGRVQTRQVDVLLVNRLPPNVVELPVREIGRPAPPTSEDAGPAGKPWSAHLDLALSMPRRVFVRGRGLDSEWSGNLTITGTADKPQIVGVVELVRGRFEFAGKRFALQQGTIQFTGGTPIDPYLNATAELQTSSITAQIKITGLASKPTIEITSQPPLPQSEVLSQVLFGKSSAQLGPVEAVQLAAALDTLARGESVGENAFSFVRTLLGLDTLTVQSTSNTSNGTTGSSVAVGRYLSDSVYIGAEQGIDTNTRTGSVEVEIAPGISIESEIDQQRTGTQGALGLKWKLDY